MISTALEHAAGICVAFAVLFLALAILAERRPG